MNLILLVADLDMLAADWLKEVTLGADLLKLVVEIQVVDWLMLE